MCVKVYCTYAYILLGSISTVYFICAIIPAHTYTHALIWMKKMVTCTMLALGHCKNMQQIETALFLVVPCYFCVFVALSLELVLPAGTSNALELATQQTQACKCYQM